VVYGFAAERYITWHYNAASHASAIHNVTHPRPSLSTRQQRESFQSSNHAVVFFVFFGISVNSTALSNCRIFSLFAPVSKLLTFSYFNVMLFAFASAFPCLKFFDMPQHFTLSKQSYSGSVSIQLLLPLDLRFQICTMKCNYGKCYTFL